MSDLRLIQRVLVADRGEAGARLVRAVEAAGFESVAVFADADADAPHLDEAAYAVRLPAQGLGDPYLEISSIITAALDSGADAIHPGFRGLARSAEFAMSVHNCGMAWLGPRLDDLAWTLDRSQARSRAREAGLELMPSSPLLIDPADVDAWCERFGFPVVIRTGRRGVGRAVVAGSLAEARRAVLEAGEAGAFAERALNEARHVVVVVVGDGVGAAVSVGEHEASFRGPAGARLRECPSPGVSPALREKICDQAREFIGAWRFLGAAAVHFLVGPDGQPWFLDVDPGLPDGFALHDLVYGTDLVGAQVALAAGEDLGWDQAEIVATGHAVEVAIVATGKGKVKSFKFPENTELDTVVSAGLKVDPAKESVLARVRARAPTRQAALVRLRAVLEAAEITGPPNDLAQCVALLGDRNVWDGQTARRVGAPIEPPTPAAARPGLPGADA